MKAKEITAIVKYYDTELRNLQSELDVAKARFANQLVTNNAQNEANRMAGLELVNQQLSKQFDELMDKYDELEQRHAAAIAGFKSDTELLQAELDATKTEARLEKQEVAFLRQALDSATSSLACVTVDAVAHCNGQDADALRKFIELVQEYATLGAAERAQLDAILANLDHNF